MLFHAGVPFVGGGFLGVDVFFVLSGYLITRIIHQRVSKNVFGFGVFYRSRALRILPPLLLVSFVVWGFFGVLNQAIAETRIVPAILFYANIDIASRYSPAIFNHAWSLSLEEQFYLLWPVVLLLLIKRTTFPERWVFLFYLCATVWKFHVTSIDYSWSQIYYAPDTRLSGLLLGSSLGLVCYKAKVPDVFMFLSFVALVACFYSAEWGEKETFYLQMPIVELATATLIVGFANGVSRLERFFSCAVMVRLGSISYAMYLWHYPIAWVANDNFSPLMSFGVTFFLSFLLSELTRRYVELPVSLLKRHSKKY